MTFYGNFFRRPIIIDSNLDLPSFIRQKVGMLLDTLKEEESGAHVGDDLLKTMEEIAFRSASERRERTPEK